MATPPRLAGDRAEGRAGKVTILVFSQPKTTKMATPPRLAGERAEGRGSHHFGICTAQRAEGRAGVTILAFSQPKTTKMATPPRLSPFWYFHSPKPPKWRLPRVWREKGRRNHQNGDSPASSGRKGGGTRGSHHFGIFTAQNHQNGDSPASGGRKGGGTRGSHHFGIFTAQNHQNSDSRVWESLFWWFWAVKMPTW